MPVKQPLHARTRELRELMAKHQVSTRRLAELVQRSHQCAKRWHGGFTIIEPAMLDAVKFNLGYRKQ